MATLNSLKQALRHSAETTTSSAKQPLSEALYSAAFDILVRGSEWLTYQEFIIPQLSQLLDNILSSRTCISILEIGPGPKSVLGYLPGRLRQKIGKYTAFEPNALFATRLEEWLEFTSETNSPLPCLETSPTIYRFPFGLQNNVGSCTSTDSKTNYIDEKYDVILFCHSMYGMQPKRSYIEQALEMLVEQPQGGLVTVFHRANTLHFDGLVCHQTASFPLGVVSVTDDDEELDCFASFIAGFVMQDTNADEAIRVEWRKVCRTLGHRGGAHPDQLSFNSPNVMVSFTHHATTLVELVAQVPLASGDKMIKNREARIHHSASIFRPTEVHHVQQCVRWALKHEVGLTVIGGSHSGHCLWPNVVSVDMSAFDLVDVISIGDVGGKPALESGFFVVAGAGCVTGGVVRKAMTAGLTVPLGARPSVGAGLWLQGGIGHLARLYGLACDAVVGAVIVTVDSGQIVCVGCVPNKHRPADAVAINSEDEGDLLWAIKGAGSNFGIVISIVFKSYAAPTYMTRHWVVPLSDNIEARCKLSDFDNLVAKHLDRNCSADAYLYGDGGKLHLGITTFEVPTTMPISPTSAPTPSFKNTVLGLRDSSQVVDGIGLFETDMYVSKMHGGHSGGKTSAFKRCVFLKSIGQANITAQLVAAVETRPLPLCYVHLLQGGGAVGDLAADVTAFGCRDWDFACVVTGVWPREQDGTETERSAIQWVYSVVEDLMPLSTGIYGADLGPDPRDAALAVMAFGPNRPRLSRLKQNFDPQNVLCYACPLPKARLEQKLIILVTGKSGAGKDYCADVVVSELTRSTHGSLTIQIVSISDAIKLEYAAATGADLRRLLQDRAYKEQHRSALTAYFQEQIMKRPQLREQHFLDLVHRANDIDVLLITGMRDEAPLSTFAYLVPQCRLLELYIQDSNNSESNVKALDYSPSFIFNNDTEGHETAASFTKQYLLPFVHKDLQRLADMVRQLPDFPRSSIKFRHVLGISQQPGGLALCTSLLRTHFTGDWAKVDAVACCEAGGFVYASALASRIDARLLLIREAGKLPPPIISVVKSSSHIASNKSEEKRIEMERDVISSGASVVVVDDVLATGKTLCAVLQLLREAGIELEEISIMVVAEFPVHRGRELLRQRGFGKISVQSLLIFDGV